ncbi:hypothetical protein ACOSP7_014461 [Xanthoceras sorbifolium]
MDHIKLPKLKIQKLSAVEELYWLQRSKVSWLRDGDRNTAFFHSTAVGRLKKNFISFITNESGSIQVSQSIIVSTIENYFSKVFSSSGHSVTNIEHATSSTSRSISADVGAALAAPFSGEEIRIALFDMHFPIGHTIQPSTTCGVGCAEAHPNNQGRAMLGVWNRVGLCRT